MFLYAVKIDGPVIPFYVYLLKAKRAFIIVIILQYLHYVTDHRYWAFTLLLRITVIFHRKDLSDDERSLSYERSK